MLVRSIFYLLVPGFQFILAKHLLSLVFILTSCSISFPSSFPLAGCYIHTNCLHLHPRPLLRRFQSLFATLSPSLTSNSLTDEVVEYSRSEHQQSATGHENNVSVRIAFFHAAQSYDDEDVKRDAQHAVNTGPDPVFDETAFEVPDL